MQVIDFRKTFLETDHGRRVLSQIARAASGRTFSESDLNDMTHLRMIHKAGREWLYGWVCAVLEGRKVPNVEHQR